MVSATARAWPAPVIRVKPASDRLTEKNLIGGHNFRAAAFQDFPCTACNQKYAINEAPAELGCTPSFAQ